VPDPARTLDTLVTVLILVLTVTIFYLAREILVPIAIAILLSFVLSPPVKVLRGLGLGKALSVGLVVCLTFAIAVGLGFVLTKQITDLAADAPRYQATVTSKIESTRDFVAHNPILTKLNTVAADMSRVTPPAAPKETPDTASRSPSNRPASAGAPTAQPQNPMRVEIVSPPPDALTILQMFGGAAASPLATAAFVALFIVFILLQREDVRNRFIRLVGFGDLNRTTLAMNEAASRLSRYFLAQVLLNTSFGIVVAVAMMIIGVPSAILWGIVATFMRFIPYLGSIGAALFPVLMAAASSQGWAMAIETALLFATLELITGQAIEPLVYGHNTGISPIAVVVSATFWTWLWGPIGLVLSTPLTVCLVVMGRHVERLSFLNIILGDAPPLTAAETFYQRMLVGDPSEIIDHAEDYIRAHSLLEYCDDVAMKALLMAQTDVRRGVLEDTRQVRIRDAMRDLVDDLADMDQPPPAPKPHPAALAAPIDDVDEVASGPSAEDKLPKVRISSAWARENAVVCVAGRTPLDEAAAHILADLLAQHGIGAHVEPADSLLKNQLSHLAAVAPELVILSFLDAELSVSQARFAVRRLRRHLPNIPLVAAFWMPEADEARAMGLCGDVRCDTCIASLPQALTLCLERARVPEIAEAA
jgi:predicted PurR-regulated permease PerM